jgi:methionyl-tRNA synthetase
LLDNVETNISAYRFKDAVQAVMEISRFGNGFLQEKAPWLLYKANPEDVNIANSIGFALQIAAALSALTSLFIPFAAAKMRQMLGLGELQKDGSELQKITDFTHNGTAILAAGHQLGEQAILFGKISDKKNPQFMQLVDAQKGKLETLKKSFLEAEKVAAAKIEAEKAAEAAKNKPNIEFPDFEKMDLRVGTITAAERVPKSDKLLKLAVDLGYEQRTVVSGIALSFAPEQVIGQQVTLVANLAPRKMMGIMSQGMILMATDAEGKLVFVSPTRAVPTGGIVK